MHAGSNDQSLRSGGAGAGVVAQGSRYLEDFFRFFAEMPHRGSATPNEPRAARLLTRKLEADTSADVELQPFAVDVASGAWGIAVHGVLLFAVTVAVWCAGLAAAWTWGAGPLPVRLGFLGTVPFPCALVVLLWCLAMLVSRLWVDKFGFNIASFFVPNADSCNIIAASLPRLEPAGDTPRMSERDRWTKRFHDAKIAGTRRIVVLMGHYDSARRLPPGKTPRFVLAALKNGMGRLITVMYLVLGLALAAACVLGFFGLNGAAYSGWVGIGVSLVLTLAAVMALTAAFVEGVMAAQSASLPFVQGMNDNLSGVAAIYGAIVKALPPVGARALRQGTQVITAFTGSEENGLRGASLFAKDVMAPAMQVFGEANVELINLDTVSGGILRAMPREVNFSGRDVGGLRPFAEGFHAWASGPRISAAEADASLTQAQRDSCLVPATGGAFGLRLEYAREKLPACTDLTGVCAGLPRAFRRELRGFSIVSRQTGGDDPLSRPRDDHQESDKVDTLFLDQEPANFGTVAALAMILEAYLR